MGRKSKNRKEDCPLTPLSNAFSPLSDKCHRKPSGKPTLAQFMEYSALLNHSISLGDVGTLEEDGDVEALEEDSVLGDDDLEVLDQESVAGKIEAPAGLLTASPISNVKGDQRLIGVVNDQNMVDVAMGIMGEGLSRDVCSIDVRQGHENQSDAWTAQLKLPKRTSTSNTPWKDLFGVNSKVGSDNRKVGNGCKLRIHACNEDDAVVEEKLLDEVKGVWGHALIGLVAGVYPGKNAIVGCCNSWKVRHQTYFDMSGWVVIKFERESDRDKVLEEGPYTIYGKPFMPKIMPPFFSFDDREISKVPIWVQLPHLPLEFWNENALSIIASKIGTPIQSDNLTMTKKRFAYARVLVEVDLDKELKYEVKVRVPSKISFVQKVKYEFIPRFCKDCKVIGHSSSMCVKNKSKVMVDNMEAKNTNIVDTAAPIAARSGPSQKWVQVKARGSKQLITVNEEAAQINSHAKANNGEIPIAMNETVGPEIASSANQIAKSGATHHSASAEGVHESINVESIDGNKASVGPEMAASANQCRGKESATQINPILFSFSVIALPAKQATVGAQLSAKPWETVEKETEGKGVGYMKEKRREIKNKKINLRFVNDGRISKMTQSGGERPFAHQELIIELNPKEYIGGLDKSKKRVRDCDMIKV